MSGLLRVEKIARVVSRIGGSGKFLVLLLLVLVTVYTVLFKFLMEYHEGKIVGYIDALFWTVSTITTTGEVFERLEYSTPALQLLSMLVQVTGLAIAFSAFPLVIVPWLKRNFFEILPTAAQKKLINHVIVCGYNALVESFTRELKTAGVPFLIVEKNRDLAETLFRQGMPVIWGNPEDERVLEKAGIRRASLVIANERDEENASIVLAASGAAEVKIVSVVEDRSKAKYLRYAGAKRVVSIKSLTGRYIARKVLEHLRDTIVSPKEFYDGLKIVDMPVEKESPLSGKKIENIKLGAVIVAVRSKSGLRLNPPGDYILRNGDIITAIGTSKELEELRRALGKKASHGHVIVVGRGEVGMPLVEMIRKRVVVHVVDKDEKALQGVDVPVIHEDGTSENTLIKAGIKEASALVAVMGEDMSNIYATLLARKLNPGVTIFSRVNYTSSIEKAYKAGANFVTSLSLVGGEILAKIVVAPEEYKKLQQDVMTLPEGSRLYKYVVTENSPALGKSLHECGIGDMGCAVVLLKKDSKIIMNPSREDVLEEGSTAIIFGSREAVEALREKLSR
jgi:Trk K+ transport system NAD-binding subunit